jgi:hypothetical protein
VATANKKSQAKKAGVINWLFCFLAPVAGKKPVSWQPTANYQEATDNQPLMAMKEQVLFNP